MQPIEATNYIYKYIRDLRALHYRIPLGKLSIQKVHNIRFGKAFYEADLEDSQQKVRKYRLLKPQLKSLDLVYRERYYEQILIFKPSEVILISIDETPITFSASSNKLYITIPKGVNIYIDQIKERFNKMQVTIACTNTRAIRP